jgi:predicted ATP-binding protein involved in virulence
MELVYLWVEDYKNIQKQGFNFSPRFRCDYDEEKNELNITDKDETGEFYPKNFFGDNINVTAIVGENGSGKTNLMRIIFNLLFNKYKNVKDEDISSFILIYEDNTLKKVSSNDKKFKSLNNLNNIKTIDFFNFYINYSNDVFIDKKEIHHKTDNYETPLLIEQNYKANINYLIKKRIHKFYEEIENNKITNFFNPNKINISYKEGIGRSFILSKYEGLCESFFVKDKSDKFLRENYISNIKENIQNYYEEYNLKNLNIAYMIYKYLSLPESRINKSIYIELKNLLEDVYLGNVDFSELILLFEKKIDNLETNELERYDTLKIFDGLKFNSFLKDKNKYLLIKEGLELGTYIELKNKNKINFLPSWLNIEFFDNEIKFESLSTGEKSIFILIITLLYQLKNLNKTRYFTINVILDEIEMNIHPLWQKKFLKEVIFSINKITNKKINLMLLTHSPFILSDLPKENIIFLEKGKQVYPFENGQTFGANIHTLLSHGFFMKDGLMGEFAKNKINDVINFLNGNKSLIRTNDEAQNLINIIGEPVIKKQLQKMLDSKRLSKIDEIDLIKNQMEELSKRLEEIVNAKD